MKRKIICILIIICIVLGGVGAGLAYYLNEVENSNTITKRDFIQANGKYLYTDYGKGDPVVLRGTNAGGYLLQEFWMCPTDYTPYVTDQMDVINALTSRFGADKAAELIDVYEDNYWTEADFDNTGYQKSSHKFL